VRAFRADGPQGPELDVGFVVHGSPAAGTSGPAATWAQTCAVGDAVAILDEGITFPAGDRGGAGPGRGRHGVGGGEQSLVAGARGPGSARASRSRT
jgi:hypothetical protein